MFLAGCATERGSHTVSLAVPGAIPEATGRYGARVDGGFAIPAVPVSRINPIYLRQTVAYSGREAPGTIVIDTSNRFLYLVEGDGSAVRYGVGVGREGFGWSGVADVRSKQEWPKWFPPAEMRERQPELAKYENGMPGGPGNPLGARALYLWQGNKDTLFRIHGTIEPLSIGRSMSSGCIRLLNQDIIDLYERVPLGTKVVVRGGGAAIAAL